MLPHGDGKSHMRQYFLYRGSRACSFCSVMEKIPPAGMSCGGRREESRLKYEPTEQKIFKIIYPPVLYYFISMAAQVVISSVFILLDIRDTAVSQSGISASVGYLDKIDGMIQKHSVLMNGAGASIGLVIFVLLYRRDKQKRGERTLAQELAGIRGFDTLMCYCTGATLGTGINLFLTLLPIDNILGSYTDTAKLLYNADFLVLFLVLGILVPFTEEILYRGIVYNRIRQYLGNKAALLLSALIFGVFHFNLLQGIFAFLLGLISAMLYEKYKSLMAPILLHMAVNQIAVLCYITGFDLFLSSHLFVCILFMSALLGIGGFLLHRIFHPEGLD